MQLKGCEKINIGVVYHIRQIIRVGAVKGPRALCLP